MSHQENMPRFNYNDFELKNNFQKIAQTNFEKWNNALLSKEPNQVANLYFSDAAFLPTLSGDFKIGKGEAIGYFEHFLQKNPNGKIVQETVKPLGDDNYVHDGFYNFEVKSGDNIEIVPARFTFVWGKNREGEWKIVSHHSSLKPVNK